MMGRSMLLTDGIESGRKSRSKIDMRSNACASKNLVSMGTAVIFPENFKGGLAAIENPQSPNDGIKR